MTDLTKLSLLMSVGTRDLFLGDEEAKTLARRLLCHFGSLEALLLVDAEEWKRFDGMEGARLQLMQILAAIMTSEALRNHPVIGNSSMAFEWFRELQGRDQEIMMAAFLDNENKLLSKKEIFRGTINGSIAQPREIFRAALKANAVQFILAHNHPSNNSEPSEDDIRFTQRMEKVSRMMGIPLLDHIIVGERYFSFADAGLLKRRGGLRRQRRSLSLSSRMSGF